MNTFKVYERYPLSLERQDMADGTHWSLLVDGDRAVSFVATEFLSPQTALQRLLRPEEPQYV